MAVRDWNFPEILCFDLRQRTAKQQSKAMSPQNTQQEKQKKRGEEKKEEGNESARFA